MQIQKETKLSRLAFTFIASTVSFVALLFGTLFFWSANTLDAPVVTDFDGLTSIKLSDFNETEFNDERILTHVVEVDTSYPLVIDAPYVSASFSFEVNGDSVLNSGNYSENDEVRWRQGHYRVPGDPDTLSFVIRIKNDARLHTNQRPVRVILGSEDQISSYLISKISFEVFFVSALLLLSFSR